MRGVLIFSEILDVKARTVSGPAHGGVQGFNNAIKLHVAPDELGLDNFNRVDGRLYRFLHRRLECARRVRGLDHAHPALLAGRRRQVRRVAGVKIA